MKKAGALIVLFLALVSASFAAEKQIFSGQITTDENIIAEGNTFRFSYDEFSKKAFAQNPGTNMIIGLGECKSNDFFRICINSANFSHKNITTYKNFYDMDVVIYESDFDLVFNSTYPAQLLQGEQADFSFNIRNPSSVPMQDLALSMNVGSFAVTDVKVCDFDGQTVSWKGDFPPAYYKSCSMKITGYKEGTFTLSAAVNYTLNYQKVTQQKSIASIKILPNQIKVESFFDSKVELTKPFHFNFSVTNIHPDEDMDVTALISFPLGLDFIKEPYSYDKSTGRIKESYKLEPGNSKNYSYNIKSDKEIKTPFTLELLYSIKGIPDSYSNATFINITEPSPIIEIIPQSYTASPGQKFVVLVKITNPSETFAFERLKGTLESKSNANIMEQIEKLSPKETYPIISHTIVIPKDASGNYTLSFMLDYWLNNFKNSESKSAAIKVGEESSSSASSNSPAQFVSPDIEKPLNPPKDIETAPFEESDLSTLEGFALILGSFGGMNTFQKIMLIFGIMLIISIFSIFIVIKKLKAKENEKLREAAAEVNKKEP